MDTVVSSGIVKSVKQECHYMYYFTLSIFNVYSDVGHNELHFFSDEMWLTLSGYANTATYNS